MTDMPDRPRAARDGKQPPRAVPQQLTTQPAVARELAQHSLALRALARSLVGQDDADDLAQDTALRALRSPPPEPARLWSWLATVMRNLAANRHRDSARRRRHQAADDATATADANDCAATRVAHSDTLRVVMETLWSLPEPYQSTLVRHFFHGLPPTLIANASGTPIATVKSRLQRGLERMRAELRARDGRDWRVALLPLLGPRSDWPRPLLPVSATTMSTCGKGAAAATLCAALFLTWCLCRAASQDASGSNDTVPPDQADRWTTDTNRTPTLAREHVIADSATDIGWLSQPYGFELRCRVIDAEGLPIDRAHVAVAPPSAALAQWPVATDANGEVVIVWRGRVANMVMALGLADTPRLALQQVPVAAGERADVVLVAGISPLPSHAELDATGRQVVTMPECTHSTNACRTCHPSMPAVSVFELRGQWRRGLHPDARFGDRLVQLPSTEPSPIQPGDAWRTAIALGGSSPAPRHLITGRVFGATGVGQPHVSITVRGAAGARARFLTDASGAFAMPWPGAAGEDLELQAGGGPEGRVRRRITTQSDQTVVGDLYLDTGGTLRGSAIDSRGQPMNGATVEYVANRGQDGDVATVNPDGRFAFANLPAGHGTLLLWGKGGERLPIAYQRSVLPDAGELIFDMRERPAAQSELRLVVRSHDGAPVDAEVRIWQLDTGRGAWLIRATDGSFRGHGLAAGHYRVEAGARHAALQDLGAHWVDGRTTADLGTVHLPTPARCRIITAPSATGLELHSQRDALDVRLDDLADTGGELLLPPGRWLALWRDGQGIATQRWSVAAGSDVVIRLSR